MAPDMRIVPSIFPRACPYIVNDPGENLAPSGAANPST